MKHELFGRPLAYYQERQCRNTAAEIAQQPALWKRLVKELTGQKREIEAFMETVSQEKRLRIVTTGAGSSAFIGETFQFLLAEELGIYTENVHTTDIISAPEGVLFDIPTLLISYARSGESPESIAAVQFAEQRISKLFQIIFVCDTESSLAKAGYQMEGALVIGMPPESCDKGFAMTSSVSCMSIATWCVFHYQELEQYAGYVNALAESVAEQIDGLAESARQIAKEPYRRIIWLGTGPLKGLAREAAVKSMELSNGYVHAGYDGAAAFRHGPKTVINEETLTVHFLSENEYSRNYDLDLAREVIREKQQNLVAIVRPEADGMNLAGRDYEAVYRLPKCLPQNSGMGAYLFSLVFSQLLSMEKSLELGCTTDNPCPKGEVNRVVQGVVIYQLPQKQKQSAAAGIWHTGQKQADTGPN
ncbi:MAG: SIS domain-containing protein [Lachnospiraceae bacterium]|jgi:tagatose-6-phosphate ketose/aldose isomerase|nr:SIS domain-containing protein [Lachnospiraceae bacterium]